MFLVIMSSMLWMIGCSPFVDNNQIEEISPVIWWSITEGTEGKLRISTLVPPIYSESKKMLTQEVDLLKEGGKDFNLSYYREVKSGQLRMVFIEQELAKKGITSLMNTLFTDPDISQRLYIVIVNGSFDDFIKNQIKTQDIPGYLLYRLLKHYENKKQGDMTIVNLHQFMKRYYSPYSDPVAPIFKVDKEHFIYEGTAFFKNDKLQTNINKRNEQIFQLIDHNHHLKVLTIPELSISIGNVTSETKMKLNLDYSTLSLNVELKGRIEEYRGKGDIDNLDQLAVIHQQIKSLFEKQTTELLKKMQKSEVDPLEIGTLTLGPFSKPMSEDEWSTLWANVKFNVTYELHIQPLTNVRK
ncbi:Ger(x)C family spore germination protein [Paenibacillus sp. LjRoot153]|uniref:Ger(x)C family spore germination protein n=1 Tax=Paenibacillus sp. LjRoot153 TaxID=3342270 RepID=UPI003ECEDFD6